MKTMMTAAFSLLLLASAAEAEKPAAAAKDKAAGKAKAKVVEKIKQGPVRLFSKADNDKWAKDQAAGKIGNYKHCCAFPKVHNLTGQHYTVQGYLDKTICIEGGCGPDGLYNTTGR